jgi:hypothetical protein
MNRQQVSFFPHDAHDHIGEQPELLVEGDRSGPAVPADRGGLHPQGRNGCGGAKRSAACGTPRRAGLRAATPTPPDQHRRQCHRGIARCPSAGAALRPAPMRLGRVRRETLRRSAEWRDVLGRSQQTRQNSHTTSLPTPAPSPPTRRSHPLAIIPYALRSYRNASHAGSCHDHRYPRPHPSHQYRARAHRAQPLDPLPEDPAGHVSKADRDQHAVRRVAGIGDR